MHDIAGIDSAHLHGREVSMAPEEVYYLVALRMRFEDDQLVADGERVDIPNEPLYVTWYTSEAIGDQISIAGGLVQVPNKEGLVRKKILKATPSDIGGSYSWREPLSDLGDSMVAMSLPIGFTIIAEPKPVEAKEFEGTIAIFWRLPPEKLVALTWRLSAVEGDRRTEIQKINREGMANLLESRGGRFDYDVAFSFAGEDRGYVQRVAEALKAAGVSVFYDRFEEASLWGKDLYTHLSEIYAKRARYTVMFISKHYADKVWTSHERESAQARALQENSEYILPARFDDSPVPGLPSTVGYLTLNGRVPEDLADLIVAKLRT